MTQTMTAAPLVLAFTRAGCLCVAAGLMQVVEMQGRSPLTWQDRAGALRRLVTMASELAAKGLGETATTVHAAPHEEDLGYWQAALEIAVEKPYNGTKSQSGLWDALRAVTDRLAAR